MSSTAGSGPSRGPVLPPGASPADVSSGPLPKTEFQENLDMFVKTTATVSGALRDASAVTLFDFSPENIKAVFERALPSLRVVLNEPENHYAALGFRQTVPLSVFSRADSKQQIVPVSVAVLQCASQQDAYDAFTQHVASHQAEWSKIFSKPANALGTFALQTSSTIFWQRWSTVVILEARDKMFYRPTPKSPARVIPSYVLPFATALDDALVAARGQPSAVKIPAIRNVKIPEVSVGSVAVGQILLQPGAHAETSLEQTEYGIATIMGGVEGDGYFGILGEQVGTTKLRFLIAHKESLRILESDLPVKVIAATNPATGS